MDEELHILWTSDNIVTAQKMVLLYAHNALKREWWKRVTVIVWGAATALVATNAEIRTTISEMIADGVRFSACKACSDQLDATVALEELGIEVKYWGSDLTALLKSGAKLLTI